MQHTTRALLERAERTAARLRAAGQNDRANRFCGRAEVVIARHCARYGELLPTLYVRENAVKSGAACQLTTWTGSIVAPLKWTGTVRGFHGTKLYCYSATIEGRAYIGRGLGPGMYVNMRPSKRS